MTEQDWSKEPWRVICLFHNPKNYGVAHPNDNGPSLPDLLVGETMTLQDSVRTVACVNACAGIPNEALEDGVIQELVAIVTRYTEYGDVFRYDYTDLNPYQRAKDVLAKFQQPEAERLAK